VPRARGRHGCDRKAYAVIGGVPPGRAEKGAFVFHRYLSKGLAIALATATLCSCTSQGVAQNASAPADAQTTPQAAVSSAAPTAPAAAPLSVADPWVKTAASGMTAAFGTLVNNTDAEVTVVSATTAAAPVTELHEVVDDGGSGKMQPKEGGIVIPPRGRHVLEPGGDHIMLMQVERPIEPGAQVHFTLTLKDGSTVEFTAVGKDFAGANETYDPSGHGSGGQLPGDHGPGEQASDEHGSGEHGSGDRSVGSRG
jgi:copper(I)-binding protein